MLSAFIICFNEEETIKRAIDSLYFADEIIVVDSGSTDKTLEIIGKNPKVKLFHRDWTGFSDQKNFAITSCNNNWIFSLDADEAVSSELAQKVLSIVRSNETTEISCYRVRREEYFLGRHLTGGAGNPSFQERLYKKDAVFYKGAIHEYPRVKYGKYGLLQEPIHHNPNLSIERVLKKINAYTTLEASERFKLHEKTTLFHVFGTFFTTFMKNFITYKGFKNGKEGVALCFLEAFCRSIRHLKLWAMHREIRLK